MSFIVLTDTGDNDEVYVNVDRMLSFVLDGDHTVITLVDGNVYWVHETPSQIATWLKDLGVGIRP
jgi:hypothetical protein